MSQRRTTIVIATKNRSIELYKTLLSLKENFFNGKIIVYNDCSTDDTSSMIKSNFPEIDLINGGLPKGYIYARNVLLNSVTTEFALSLDDDATIIASNFFDLLENKFDVEINVAVISFRIWWGKALPNNYEIHNEKESFVQSFVGCGHAWRMSDWKLIPNYPEWFNFYGEEMFAAFHLFHLKKSILYFPDLFIHHRVEVKKRKLDKKQWKERQINSLSTGWFLFFLFFPYELLLITFIKSIYNQLKKISKGDLSVFSVLIFSIINLIINYKNLFNNSKRLSVNQYTLFSRLPLTKIFWISNEK